MSDVSNLAVRLKSLRLAIALVLLSAMPAVANLPQLCERAARDASDRIGVPLEVLRAITLTETGRKMSGAVKPWPWTVNMEGAGHWFDTRDAAKAFVFKRFKEGARSFDVGCFQVNYKWHGQAFASIEDMFDPLQNALYAASFLKSLREELGDWRSAAGAYHSRTPEYAKRYVARFDEFLAQTSSGQASGAAEYSSDDAQNGYPFLFSGDTTPRGGSLVPIGNQTKGSLLRGARPLTGG